MVIPDCTKRLMLDDIVPILVEFHDGFVYSVYMNGHELNPDAFSHQEKMSWYAQAEEEERKYAKMHEDRDY